MFFLWTAIIATVTFTQVGLQGNKQYIKLYLFLTDSVPEVKIHLQA